MAEPSPLAKATVLMVEDDPHLLQLVSWHLSWTLANFGSGVDPERRLGGDVIQGLIERHGRYAEGA